MYTKILVGKYSPLNGCHVPDGNVLTVIPHKKITKAKSHHFSDSRDKKVKSRYGWVKTVPEFGISDFIREHGVSKDDELEMNHLKILLDSISKLSDDTAVAADYFERGLENKHFAFVVHKVIFYEGKP